MSFTDMIKKSVLEGFTASDLSTTEIAVTLGMSVVFGLFIYIMYRLTSKSGFYNRGFNKSLAILPVITTGIILAMQSNLVISLGMVGALSIVRFRTAVKEPMEIAFLFWAISEGIVIGAGMIPVALIGAAFVGVVLVAFHFLSGRAPATKPYILVLHAENDAAEENAQKAIAASVKRQALKSKTVTAAGTELTVEVRLAGTESAFVNDLRKIPGVADVTLVSYNGDYMA